jgi:hypothetical protein
MHEGEEVRGGAEEGREVVGEEAGGGEGVEERLEDKVQEDGAIENKNRFLYVIFSYVFPLSSSSRPWRCSFCLRNPPNVVRPKQRACGPCPPV